VCFNFISCINENIKAGTVPLFPFPVRFWLKTAVSVFHGFVFFIQKMSIAPHIMFVENDENYYFASNHIPDGQQLCLFINLEFM